MRRNRWLILGAALLAAVLVLGGCGNGTPEYDNGNDGAGTGDTNGGMGPGDGGGGMGPGNRGGGDSGTGTQGDGTGMMDTTVLAQDFAFMPPTLEVNVGETVTWTNSDDAAHDVEIDGRNLGRMSNGETLTWTPEQPGSYPYACTIHPAMKGTIVVQ